MRAVSYTHLDVYKRQDWFLNEDVVVESVISMKDGHKSCNLSSVFGVIWSISRRWNIRLSLIHILNQDKGLQGNEKIEQAIAALQQEATQEMLAHTLTVIRRRMRENGQFILSVEPPTGDNQLRIGTVKTGDGKVWWVAFTSFEEELKGGGSVQSTFLTDIDQLFNSALQVNEIEGIILNPWNRTIMLDKNLINIILGNI